ncbi:MAG: hypothetical protein JRI23_02215 [Deltaproteobacteria bacterium]|jgi:hypothetical protein|nr:hypothetical protein [Deltaproteobacteria bacterium]MBW2530294.1 hypothetical protein [Deltaproteobacteria bacterium]
MNAIDRARPSASSLLISAAALSLALAAGCGAEQAAGSSAQYDTEDPAAACSAAEMDPLLACAAEPCAGLSGDPLSECIDVSCPPEVFDVTEGCAGCIVVNLSSIEDVGHYCGGSSGSTEPVVAACSAAEIDPLLACATEPCAGLSGDPLSECFDLSCPPEVFDVTEGCAGCIIASLASVEAIAHNCGG